MSVTERDKRMFELVCKYIDTKFIAEKLGVAPDTIYQRFRWLRKKREEWQRNVNILNNAERKCKRLKKMLTSRNLKKGET